MAEQVVLDAGLFFGGQSEQAQRVVLADGDADGLDGENSKDGSGTLLWVRLPTGSAQAPVLGMTGRLRRQLGGVLGAAVFGGRASGFAVLAGGSGDLVQDVAAVGPFAQIAPGFGVALGQRFVVAVCAGHGAGWQRVAFGLPQDLGVLQADPGFVETGERAAPVRLALGCGQRGNLAFGEGQKFLQVRAEWLEGPPGVGVALTLAATVRKVVQWPALVVDAGVGVGVPVPEDVCGSPGVDGEPVQEELVVGGVDRTRASLWSGSWRRAGATVFFMAGLRVASAAMVLRCLRAAWRVVGSPGLLARRPLP
ncbi:hypothetical protein [Actinacidiphila rubida]|uniref:hypothetical protein n=2 Tax=Actinacidiphila rubida TaxID=310780 RepID=UPI001160A465|nr:hypothetical protein [Actinacidiphila rubida]